MTLSTSKPILKTEYYNVVFYESHINIVVSVDSNLSSNFSVVSFVKFCVFSILIFYKFLPRVNISIMEELDNIKTLLALLCAIDWLANDLHYRSEGTGFYEKHLLADRIRDFGDAED